MIEKSLSSPTKDANIFMDVHVAIEKVTNNLDPSTLDKWAGPASPPDLMTPPKAPTRVGSDARPSNGFQQCIWDVVQNAMKKEEWKLQALRNKMEGTRVFLNNEKVKLSYASMTKATLVEDIARKREVVGLSEDFIAELVDNKIDDALEMVGVCE